MLVAVGGDIHHVISEDIEDVKVGDEVLTRNQNDPNAPLEAQPVVQLYQHTVYSLEDVTIQGSDGSTEIIRCTTQHPFYVEGIGWVGSGQLVAGERLIQADGSKARVVSAVAESDAQGVTVYNFEVANDHTYFVDENGEAVWVHNRCNPLRGSLEDAGVWGLSTDQAAHIVPVGAWSARKNGIPKLVARAQNILTKNGIDLNSYWNGFRAGSGHLGTHTDIYFKAMYDQLSKDLAKATVGMEKVAVIRSLQTLRNRILSGEFI